MDSNAGKIFISLEEMNPELSEQFIGLNRGMLVGAGILILALAAVVICLIAICVRRGHKKEILIMKEESFQMVKSVQIGKLHEQGKRSGQQDCFGVSDKSLMDTKGFLAVVADGMGGLADGDKVSKAAVEAILDGFTLYQGKCTAQQMLLFLAQQATETVNQQLGLSGLRKSGSTLVMGLVRDGMFSFLTVGDSRICLYRNGILTQLNREHIYRNKLALDAINGKIPMQEVFTDQRGEGLTSFLGMGELEQIDMPAAPLRLLPGDKLLLMSDGVYNALSEEELTEALRETPKAAAEKLHQSIQEKAYINQDNYTAVILECMIDDDAGQETAIEAEQLSHTENPEN